jgi:hypothetical protein
MNAYTLKPQFIGCSNSLIRGVICFYACHVFAMNSVENLKSF